MFKTSALALALVLCAGSTFAQTPSSAAAPLSKPGTTKPAKDKPASDNFDKNANASCESKAIDKNGKPLSGAAKGSSIKKCEADAKSAPSAQSTEVACEAKALSKDGKALAGAAKTASVKKCVADATPAKT